MDTFQLNKIAGAVLGTLTVLLGVNVLVEEVFQQKKPEKPGYEIAAKPEAAPAAAAAAAGAPAAPEGVAMLLASADPVKGEQVAKKCAACHSFGKGQPAKAGPNLYGIIGLKHGHMEGFGYSDAMKKTSDKVWDFENIDHWLENPKGYITGTSMAFAGVKAPEERANLIAYLNKNSDSPKELPKAPAGGAPAAAPAAGGAAPAGAAAAADGGFAVKVAAADPAKGMGIAKRCGACHGFEKGGAAKVGPNLYGIVGLKHGHMEGFAYSEAMKKTSDKVWDVENLNKWLENPKGYIAGTSMAFAGIKSEDDRAALVAYLNKNSDKPVDLGGAAAPAPAAGDKKAEDAPAKPSPAAPAPAEVKKAEAESAPAPSSGAAPLAASEAPAAAPAADPAPAAPAAGGDPIEKRMAAADPAAGEKAVEAQCSACHSLNKGGETIAGPNLYGIVGSKHGHVEGFEYSEEFKAHTQGPWDFALLDQWLEDPAKVVPGTMMAFEGVKDAQERANIIAYLNKNSDTPAPIPGK